MGSLRGWQRAGVALVSVMLIALMLFLMTMAFLSKQKLEHQTISYQLSGARARVLALAGLEDALAKLDKDYAFPPAAGPAQLTFDYTERLTDTSGNALGQYAVTIDSRFRLLAPQILLIKVRGEIGTQADNLQCATLQAYLDANPANPTFFKVIQLEWLAGGF